MDQAAFQSSVAHSNDLSLQAQKTAKWRRPRSVKDPKARFPGFHQRKVQYRAGQVVKNGYMPLPCDLIMHESVPMTLSDGTTLYSDIFLPAGFEDLERDCSAEEKVPGLVAWSPYGKQVGTQILSDYPFHCGVLPSTVSSLQKWEGPDPAFWCANNYAIINVDIRGTYTSAGDAHLLGHQEAKDGAEFIEWIAAQPWCNGRVGMSGNSWLAVSQWKIASLRPHGLAGISPWEGMMDAYKDVVCAGGIPDTGPLNLITSAFAGEGKVEDLVAGVSRPGKEGIYDEYWEDKRSVVERITCPVYCVASWTSIFHTNGTLRAFRLLPQSTPKWLRVHNTQEWPDYYSHRNILDLKRFFDWCLKSKDTAWTATAPLRLSVLNFGIGEKEDTIERAENEFPLARTKYTRYYLAADKTLSLTPPQTPSTLTYDANSGSLSFKYTIPHDLETTGYPRAHLYISCSTSPNHPNTKDEDRLVEIDVFTQIELLKPTKWRAGTLVIRPQSGPAHFLLKLMHDWQIGMSKLGILYHYGPEGRLRASFAHETSKESSEFEPIYAFKQRRRMKVGEVRELVIPMRAYGMYWGKGDILRFTVSGKPIVPFALPGLKGPETENEGIHVVHLGGKGNESSHLVLPVV